MLLSRHQNVGQNRASNGPDQQHIITFLALKKYGASSLTRLFTE
jgi:hypothetical protein